MQNKNVRQLSEFNKELKLKGFNVFQIESDGAATRIYSRKDFYKICLTTGKSNIHYAERSFEEEGTILFFGNPHIPYSWGGNALHHLLWIHLSFFRRFFQGIRKVGKFTTVTTF